MSLIKMRMWMPLRRTLYVVLGTSWCSGVTYFILSRWMMVEGEFGVEKHPWQFPILKIHGAAAFVMLMAIGALLIHHLPPAWRADRSRRLGISLLAGVGLMVLSAWLLYYSGSEQWRPLIANVHAFIGFSLPAMLLAHVWRGRVVSARTRRRPSVRPAFVAAATAPQAAVTRSSGERVH